MKKHTPGLLRITLEGIGIDPKRGFRHQIGTEEKTILYTFDAACGDAPTPEQSANAEHVIRCWNAFPEMLEALKLVMAFVDEHKLPMGCMARGRAEEALWKAGVR